MTTIKDLEKMLHDAIRSGDQMRKDTLRLVLTSAKLAEVEKGTPLDSDALMVVLHKEAKARRESIADAQRAERMDLITPLEDELEYLETFLPQPLSETELKSLVEIAIEESGAQSPKEMGLVMKLLVPRIQGRADGRTVSDLVRTSLSESKTP
jgi:uncharacterized protein